MIEEISIIISDYEQSMYCEGFYNNNKINLSITQHKTKNCFLSHTLPENVQCKFSNFVQLRYRKCGKNNWNEYELFLPSTYRPYDDFEDIPDDILILIHRTLAGYFPQNFNLPI
jgi:hypothetical protein